MAEDTRAASGEGRLTDRHVEWITAVMLAMVTLATAWCGYQASQWNGEQSITFGRANAARVESTRSENMALQRQSVHVALFVEYASAVSTDNDNLAEFLFERFPPELKTATEAWLALRPLENADAPPSPFDMSEYALPERAEAEELEAQAAAYFLEGLENDTRGDRYTLMTVVFAMVLFFLGISGQFAGRGPRLALIGLSAVIFVIGVLIVATFPVIPL